MALTDVSSREASRQVLQHQLGDSVTASGKLGDGEAPIGCVTLQIPILIRVGIRGIQYSVLERNHLSHKRICECVRA